MLFVGGSANADTGCAPGPNEISLFGDANYGGQCATFEVGDFASLGALDNAASSVWVGANVVAVLEQVPGLIFCCDDQWSTFETNDPNLSNDSYRAGGIVDNTASAHLRSKNELHTRTARGCALRPCRRDRRLRECPRRPRPDYDTTLPLGLPDDFRELDRGRRRRLGDGATSTSSTAAVNPPVPRRRTLSFSFLSPGDSELSSIRILASSESVSLFRATPGSPGTVDGWIHGNPSTSYSVGLKGGPVCGSAEPAYNDSLSVTTDANGDGYFSSATGNGRHRFR